MPPAFRSHALVLSLSVLIVAPINAEQPSGDFQIVHTGPGLSLHKEMFMLPATYSDEYHSAKTEAVFQISAKHRLFNSRVYFAYTQISFWQAYDHKNSAPFRETNYNPEIFYRAKPFELKSWWAGFDVGVEHESNGQRPPVSRSWNLLYVTPYFYTSSLLVNLKFRYRVPEDDKEFPEASVGDDNPDITDYLGYNDLNVYFKFWRNHTLHLTLRGNLSKSKGGLNLSYSFPVPKSRLSFIGLRISHGYGESLVDYNKLLTRVGVGIMFMR